MALVENHLIELLPERDRMRLLARCEPVSLALAQVLCEAGTPLQHVFFPINSFISLVTQIDHHPTLEVGMLGRDGVLGASLVLGVSVAPLQAMVQGGGLAWRVATSDFLIELNRSVALHHYLLRYLYVRMAQLETSAACLRFHLIGPRLARWLLMSQDCAHADHFWVTHEFLSYMLGVRRVGITEAASAMQSLGLITYHRGHVTVLDRPGLEAIACSCYAADRRSYAKWLGTSSYTPRRTR